MPHDVIMPALGVAQDTGLIISWLKQSGDVVSIGDALMEIETDKAVMEVEAQADGYLTNVSAVEGEQVPVGQVVAVISESADVVDIAATDQSQSQSTQEASVAETVQSSMPDSKEIIMPALGMAQDTGVIVAWHKNPGEPVIATDILLDVETDKSVMEVEAGHTGYVAAILADALEVVPVGSTIAVISATKPEKPALRNSSATAQAADTSMPSSVKKSATTPIADNVQAQNAGAVNSTNAEHSRLLASPKARRLANEQGLDLHRLIEHGVPQPYHVADLETLKALANHTPASKTSTQASELPSSSVLRVDARVPESGHIAFMDWIKKHKDISVPAYNVWLRFATAALRRSTQRDNVSLTIEVTQTSGTVGCYTDADRSRLSKPITQSVDLSPALILRDFSASPIVSITSSAQVAPVLTIRQEQDNFLISLDYRQEQLDENEAIEFTTEFAQRVAEPLRHLL